MATTTTHYGFTKPGVNDYVDISVLNANFDNLDNVIYNNQLRAQAALNDIAPEYDATATYSVDDYVTYNKTLYKCATAIATAEAFDDTKWTAVKVGGELKSHDTRISTLEAGVDLEKSATNSFDDGIDSYFKKVVSTIVPVQAGSGTPSPTNVRAISGFTECAVKDFGNNFMPQKDVSVPDTVTNSYVTLDLPKGTYTISAKVSSDTSDTNCRLSFRKGTTQIEATFIGISTARTSVTVTLLEDCNRIYFYGGHSTTTYANTTYTDIQIERGSTATDYTPYIAPNTATISFGTAGTVYGARVDLISGKLVVDRAIITDISVSWISVSKNSANPAEYLYFMRILDNTKAFNTANASLICSHAPNVGVVPSNEVGVAYSVSYNVIYCNFGELPDNTAVGLKSFWSENNIQLAYKLATPQEYQLTPAQLRSLVGANRLTSSTGEVTEVEYIKNKTIAWLLDLIRA